jgi:hypothetical protein
MNAWLIVAFVTGAFAHKVWRVIWQAVTDGGWRHAIVDEFRPPARTAPEPPSRPLRVTEIA